MVIVQENVIVRNGIQARLSHKENSPDDLRIESHLITILINFCFICYWTGLVKLVFSWMERPANFITVIICDSLGGNLDGIWPG